MAGRGRGATLPAWMTAPAGAPGGASLATASNPPTDTGICMLLYQAQAFEASLDTEPVFSEPTYSPDVLDAAKAQVLQEQDLAMQQALATHRLVFEQSTTCILYRICIVQCAECIASLPWSCSGQASTEDAADAEAPQAPAVLKVKSPLCSTYCMQSLKTLQILHEATLDRLTDAHLHKSIANKLHAVQDITW